MKWFFGWKKMARICRDAIRILIRKPFKGKNEGKVVEKTTLALARTSDETPRCLPDAPTRKTETQEKERLITCGKTTRRGLDDESETAATDAEKNVKTGAHDAANEANVATENAFVKTSIAKTNGNSAQPTENKAVSDCVAAEERVENGADNGKETDDLESCSTGATRFGEKTQSVKYQGIRAWVNDEGKTLVNAALEIDLSARSSKFVFFRSARGRLYRYPWRRLSFDDRVWINKALGVNVADEGFEAESDDDDARTKAPIDETDSATVGDLNVAHASVALADVESEGEVDDLNVAHASVALADVESEGEVGDLNVANASNAGAATSLNEEKGFDVEERDGDLVLREDLDLLDSQKDETLQTVEKQGIDEYDDVELRLRFWEDEEDDATSFNGTERRESLERVESEEDEQTGDLRLNFWNDDDVSNDMASTEKANINDETQVNELKELDEAGECKARSSRDAKNPAHKTEATRRQQEKRKNESERKNEKKRKSATSYDAEYYEPFSRMEPETLDGLLYDYCDDLDAIRDEIEAERIIDYYDWTYGSARYRDESDEWE